MLFKDYIICVISGIGSTLARALAIKIVDKEFKSSKEASNEGRHQLCSNEDRGKKIDESREDNAQDTCRESMYVLELTCARLEGNEAANSVSCF